LARASASVSSRLCRWPACCSRKPFLLSPVRGVEFTGPRVVPAGCDTTPATRDASSTWITGAVVGGRDPHRGVLPRGRRAPDEQRQGEAAAPHLGRRAHHLVE